jgi:hypothetical protein
MTQESLHKLYQHFLRSADANKYHGNVTVLSGFLKVPESSLRDAMKSMHKLYPVQIFWFSELDFIVDLSNEEHSN